jgi:hypothetical protein
MSRCRARRYSESIRKRYSAAETAPAADLRSWLATLHPDELIDLVVQAADGDSEYRRRLHLRARQP